MEIVGVEVSGFLELDWVDLGGWRGLAFLRGVGGVGRGGGRGGRRWRRGLWMSGCGGVCLDQVCRLWRNLGKGLDMRVGEACS